MSKIAIPLMGNYEIPATYFLKKILKAEMIQTPKISKKTIELGTKNSPEFICTPFKYTLGSFIEALEKGADVLIQMGGGCRYGYYYELQEQILKDLGYDFTLINLVSKGKTDLKKVIQEFKKINNQLSILKTGYYFIITKKMIGYMDEMEDYMRHHMGFEIEPKMEKYYHKMLKEFSNIKGYFHLRRVFQKYKKKIKKVPINRPKNRIRIGIIGELYTIMEPFSNYELEKKLLSYHVDITRFTNVTYLLFKKKSAIKKLLKSSKEYVRYKMGADASDNIARTKYMCKNKYDAIIHIKSTFCTPEIGAMPIITKICEEYKVPLLFFSFDSQTSTTGLQTRIEALMDMIEMRKKHE